MFPHGFFPASYFAPTYFPPADVVVVPGGGFVAFFYFG